MNDEKKLFELRCSCGRLLGYLNGELKTKCPKCKKQVDFCITERKDAVQSGALDAQSSTDLNQPSSFVSLESKEV